MVYYTIFPRHFETSDYEKIYSNIAPFLPKFRRKKAENIIPIRERAVSALSFILLCHGLLMEYPHRFQVKDIDYIGNSINFSYGCNGKPALSEPYNDIFFNISHCRTAIACAIAPFEVGVDIQDIRRPSPAVLRRIPHAMNDEEFSTFWSRYEAYTKLTGDGITKSFADCDYMSKEFLCNSNVTIVTTPVLYPDTLNACSKSDKTDNAQKKTAAFLSTAFCASPQHQQQGVGVLTDNINCNNSYKDNNVFFGDTTLRSPDISSCKKCFQFDSKSIIPVELSSLCHTALL